MPALLRPNRRSTPGNSMMKSPRPPGGYELSSRTWRRRRMLAAPGDQGSSHLVRADYYSNRQAVNTGRRRFFRVTQAAQLSGDHMGSGEPSRSRSLRCGDARLM